MKPSRWLPLALLLLATRVAHAADSLPSELPPPMSTLDLEWEEVDEADGYELKLTPKTGGEPLTFRVTENKISQRVPSGVYLLQIRSKEKATGYFGAWSESTEIDIAPKVVELLEPKDQEVISEPKEKRHDVVLRWRPISGVRLYRVRIWDEAASEKSLEFTTANSSKTLKLLTSHAYAWTVTVEDEKSVRYYTKPEPFRFSVMGKKLLPPEIDTKIDPTDVRKLSWKASAKARTYRVRLETKALDETVWQVVSENAEARERKISFKKLKAGNYRLEVIAEAPLHVSSDPAKFEFTVKPSAAELENALE